MTHDRQITISTGNSRREMSWKQETLSVSELYERLRVPSRGVETLAAYMKMGKKNQDNLKDVGGFVGGSLNSPRRKAENTTGRDLITLDFDSIPGWQTDAIVERVNALECSYCIYSTRKHTPSAPRLRVIIPLNRTATPDEYEPCARRIAEQIGISMADPTTFEACRLMFWPSCCADSDYIYRTKDAPLISVDFLLGTYIDWHNYMSWPQVPNAVSYQKLAMRQGDPLTKPGIVGVFCRTYDVFTAMDAFLPKIYEPVDDSSDRYTYLGGSTTGGAIIYDDGKFLFSHHATDPCSGRLVNAFDLVRLHRFGYEDDTSDPDTAITKLQSYKDMCALAISDKAVVATLNREQREQAAKDFEGVGGNGSVVIDTTLGGAAVTETEEGATQETGSEEEDWADKLQRNQNGGVRCTIDNALLILNGDMNLSGRITLNSFSGRIEVLGSLPWNTAPKQRTWSDADNNGLYWYLERSWGITGRGNIDSALSIYVEAHSFNPLQDYINGLVWDGTPRLDTLLIDYLGAQDTQYTRTVTRKMFVAAVARAMIPGCKFDNMLILCGPQGIGKSTLLDKMSKGWFNDSIRTFEGKEASELIQGIWLVEVAELNAFGKTDISRIKQFLSLRADRYRAAYAREVSERPRSCVFFGTCNPTDFLSDPTGNRRFWPVDVHEVSATKNIFTELTSDVVDQLWAEAKARWQVGEALYLPAELVAAATEQQELHMDSDPLEGIIADFLSKPVPVDWEKWTISKRRDFWAGATQTDSIPLRKRTTVCVPEVWCELLAKNLSEINNDPRNRRNIRNMIQRLGWKPAQKPCHMGRDYGTVRYFVKA